MTQEAQIAAGRQVAYEKLQQGDRTDYYSVRFAPAAQRDALAALYAFWHEVREIVDECSDPQVAHVKLAWWYDEVHAVYAGQPRHPLGKPLVRAVVQYTLPQRPFLALIEALNHQVNTTRYETFDLLMEQCRNTRGQLALLVARVAHAADEELAIGHGTLQALALALRDLGADVRRGRISLPQEDLMRFGIRPDELYDLRESEAFAKLMDFEVSRALTALQRLPSDTPPSLRIGTALCRAMLEEVRADGYRVLTQRLELTPLRQLWIAWRNR